MQELITVKNEVVEINQEAVNQLINFEKTIKQLKAQQDELKTELLKAMEEHSILKFENEDLIISYVASFDKETFDKKKFQNDNPDLYDEYVNFSKVKPSIRIKVK